MQSTLFKLILIIGMINCAFAETGKGQARDRLIKTHECSGCDLRGIDLNELNLAGVNLKGADLSGALLRNTNLRGANLQGATLINVELSDTLLAGANLKQADLSDTDIDQVFESVEIIGTQFEGARFKYGVVCGPAPIKGGWGCQHQ